MTIKWILLYFCNVRQPKDYFQMHFKSWDLFASPDLSVRSTLFFQRDPMEKWASRTELYMHKCFRKSCIVFSNVYWPAAWGRPPPSPFKWFSQREWRTRLSATTSTNLTRPASTTGSSVSSMNTLSCESQIYRKQNKTNKKKRTTVDKVRLVLLICSVFSKKKKERKKERRGK